MACIARAIPLGGPALRWRDGTVARTVNAPEDVESELEWIKSMLAQ